MIIVHKIEDFLFELFPNAKNNEGSFDALKDELERYYTYGAFKPKVTIADGWINIEIDTKTIESQDSDYKRAVLLCEKGNFNEAKKILSNLIQKNPSNSEYHRIFGQILSEEGGQEEAINSLIDALKWNPKNSFALLMMGNIFAKYKNDIETALKYYDQAVKINPKDNIAINNIGANLMQQGKLKQAKRYFQDALRINPNYPNTHYALSLASEMEGDLQSAFQSALQAIKANGKRDGLYQTSLQQAIKVSQTIIKSGVGRKTISDYKNQLELEGEVIIEIQTDENLPTAAKMELAENYGRESHLVKYKPSYPAIEHLVMHELVHLDFIFEARKINENQLFISTQQQKAVFIKNIESDLKRLNKLGISEESLAKYSNDLFDGINRQIYNTPIDLFIEDFLFKKYPEFKPYQFLSLYNLNQEALHAVTDKKIVELSPKSVLSQSKLFNLISAIHFNELYGINIINDFKATPLELNQANKFYNEYLEYREDRQPGEEYELVMHWAEDMKLERYFELMNEDEYRNKRTNIDSLLTSIEKDPYGINTKDPGKEKEMKKFLESQKAIGTNMAVAMFMVDALEYFKGIPGNRIKEIAYEIARLGTQGISPDGKDYSLHLVPGKKFSGNHLLAYYYVSWALAIPELVEKLQLPFNEEYKLAQQLFKK